LVVGGEVQAGLWQGVLRGIEAGATRRGEALAADERNEGAE
jgi:hypothetical protein